VLPYTGARHAYQALVDDNRKIVFDALKGVGHYDGGGYIEALRASVPWLTDTWKASEPK
jgi:hypothetical protein